MKQELKEKLLLLADKYEVKEFIMDDPIQFPHRYTDKADIEISGLIASWIATGNRKAIIKSGDRIDHELFLNAPYRYILSEEWRKYRGVTSSFYRYYSWNDFYILCQTLYAAYRELEIWNPICAILSLPVRHWKDCNRCSDISMGCLLCQVLPKQRKCVCFCVG